MATGFGSGLATGTTAAIASPLPTTLAGTTVKVRDSAGVEPSLNGRGEVDVALTVDSQAANIVKVHIK
ncbi:MAG: hypothetical protein ACREEM_50110 [Blastocatellia bacterium]